MRSMSLLAASVWLIACGGSTSSEHGASGGTAGTGNAGAGGIAVGGSAGSTTSGGTGGIDCSKVGCGPPPMCDTGCTSACGCCACGEGTTVPAEGGYMLCKAGCYTFVAAKTCGGIAGTLCAADEYCDYPTESQCGGDDSTGICMQRPTACDTNCVEVCGCDNKPYCNECTAHAAGWDAPSSTACMSADAGPDG